LNVQSPRFPLFDSLRAIAAVSVVLFHLAFVLHGFGRPGYGRYLIELNIGVSIFFLISGFLLYRPFVAARFGAAPLPAVGPYAIRRFFRIVPAYWVALPLVAVWTNLPAVLHDPPPYFGFAQIYDRATLLKGYGIAWTLCVEISFYALLPLWALAMRRLPGRSQRQLVIGELGALALMLAVGVTWNTTQTEVHHGTIVFTPGIATLPAFLDQFAIGMALAVASVGLAGRARQPAAVRIVHRASWLPWAVAAGAFVALCNTDLSGGVGSAVARHELRGLVALGVLLPAIFGDDRGGAIRRLLADRRVQWVGLISYSLYLWHSAVLVRLVRDGWDRRLGGVGFALCGFLVCLAIAAVSFYVVERPALRVGRRLAGRGGYMEAEPASAGAVDRPGAPSVELAGADRQSRA
jgi:peptidoglycan/LPS O-acetylase OafA/YrhL